MIVSHVAMWGARVGRAAAHRSETVVGVAGAVCAIARNSSRTVPRASRGDTGFLYCTAVMFHEGTSRDDLYCVRPVQLYHAPRTRTYDECGLGTSTIVGRFQTVRTTASTTPRARPRLPSARSPPEHHRRALS